MNFGATEVREMSYTLLIVDDERNIREGIACALDWESLGIETVILAKNGQEAYELLSKREVDIILTDIVMPEMDGLELCRFVHQEYPKILCYILSGYDEFRYAQSAMKQGVKDYILKPIDDNELLSTIQDALSQLRRRDTSLKQAAQLEQQLDGTIPDSVGEQLRNLIQDAFLDWDSFPHILQTNEGLYRSSNPVIQKMLDYVEAHIDDENLNLGQIASQHLFLNASYLGKLFKKEMQVKFSAYLLDRRIKRAQSYIKKHPNAKVYEIAEAVGFGNNASYFSTVFKKITGKSPTDFKE